MSGPFFNENIRFSIEYFDCTGICDTTESETTVAIKL